MSRVWLITDAASATGAPLVDAALSAGDRVVAGSAESAVPARLRARRRACLLGAALDLADEASVYAAINAALEAFGRIDVVVDSVDRAAAAPVETGVADVRAQFERGFFGLAGLVDAVLPVLREQGEGRIVHVASRGDGGSAAERAARCAVRGYFEALERDEAPHGIDIAVIDAGDLADGAVVAALADASRPLRERGEASRGRVLRFPSRSAA